MKLPRWLDDTLTLLFIFAVLAGLGFGFMALCYWVFGKISGW